MFNWMKFRAITLVFRENSFIPMSSIHLQCVVVQFSLTCLRKQLTELQCMGDVTADTHHSVVFELFWHKSELAKLLSHSIFKLRSILKSNK